MIFIVSEMAIFIQISGFESFSIVSEKFLELLKGYLAIFVGVDNPKTGVALFFLGQTEIRYGNGKAYHKKITVIFFIYAPLILFSS